MTREDKINALRQVLKGAPIGKAFPVLQVCTIDTGEKGFTVMVESVFRCTHKENVTAFIEKVKADNPCNIVEVVHIQKDEYDRISEQLEHEY